MVPVRLAQSYPMADAQRHTVKMKFDLPQGVSAPGMYVKVLVPDLTSPGHEAPIIPTSAIRYNGSLPAVYVIGEDGRNELRLIRVGEHVAWLHHRAFRPARRRAGDRQSGSRAFGRLERGAARP